MIYPAESHINSTYKKKTGKVIPSPFQHPIFYIRPPFRSHASRVAVLLAKGPKSEMLQKRKISSQASSGGLTDLESWRTSRWFFLDDVQKTFPWWPIATFGHIMICGWVAPHWWLKANIRSKTTAHRPHIYIYTWNTFQPNFNGHLLAELKIIRDIWLRGW